MAQPEVINGYDVVVFMRPLKDTKTSKGKLVPYQTTESFNLKRESNSTKTKTGNINSKGALEAEFSMEMTNNAGAIANAFQDAIYNGETLEIWRVYRNTKNDKGEVLAWYFQVDVTEDNQENNSDDLSSRSLSFAVNGTPKKDYLKLPNEAQEAIDYVFKGLDEDTTTTTQGAGE